MSKLFRVNGEEFPAPSGVKVSINVLDRYAERTLDGLLNRRNKDKKMTYSLSWPYNPDDSEFIRLWNKLAGLPEFASFSIPNPNGDDDYTFTGYVGKQEVTMHSYWDMGEGRKARWRDLSVELIER